MLLDEIKLLQDPTKLVVGGFNQGAMLGLKSGLELNFTLGGIISV